MRRMITLFAVLLFVFVQSSLAKGKKAPKIRFKIKHPDGLTRTDVPKLKLHVLNQPQLDLRHQAISKINSTAHLTQIGKTRYFRAWGGKESFRYLRLVKSYVFEEMTRAELPQKARLLEGPLPMRLQCNKESIIAWQLDKRLAKLTLPPDYADGRRTRHVFFEDGKTVILYPSYGKKARWYFTKVLPDAALLAGPELDLLTKIIPTGDGKHIACLVGSREQVLVIVESKERKVSHRIPLKGRGVRVYAIPGEGRLVVLKAAGAEILDAKNGQSRTLSLSAKLHPSAKFVCLENSGYALLGKHIIDVKEERAVGILPDLYLLSAHCVLGNIIYYSTSPTPINNPLRMSLSRIRAYDIKQAKHIAQVDLELEPSSGPVSMAGANYLAPLGKKRLIVLSGTLAYHMERQSPRQ